MLSRIKYEPKNIALLVIMALVFVYQSSLSAQDTLKVKEQPMDSTGIDSHKSGYNDISVSGGSKSTDGSLVADDEYKIMAWIKLDRSTAWFEGYYKFKRYLKENYNTAVGIDYMFLNQYASFSFTDRQAASGIFRFFGTWKIFGSKEKSEGSLVFKIENRHRIGHKELPRNLGYEAGSALSTASFKHFNWGLTNLFWKQLLYNKQLEIIVGQMDSGDWIDLFPLLDSYRYFMNEAYFNSPAMALPNQGLGIVLRGSVTRNFYLWGGLHDANGQPNEFGGYIFRSFFKTREYFSWIEAGWQPTIKLNPGQTVHLSYWHQDARQDQGATESWGFCFQPVLTGVGISSLLSG